MWRRITVVAVVAVGVLMGTAGAATEQGEVEVSVAGNVTIMSSTTTALALTSLGYFFTDALEVSAVLLGTWQNDDNSSSNSMYFVLGDAKYHFMTKSVFVPFVGGFGGGAFSSNGGDTLTVYGPEAGFKYFIGEKTNLFLQYQYELFSGGGDTESASVITVGLSFLFK